MPEDLFDPFSPTGEARLKGYADLEFHRVVGSFHWGRVRAAYCY